MSRFQQMWDAHPGRGYVCDAAVFENQCAMRMGTALRAIGADLTGLKTCVNYDARKYGDHRPGHVRAAQDLANHFYRKPKGHGLGATSFEIMTGSIDANIASLKTRNGMLFIMNGWGNTDHIDCWKSDGSTGILKGGDVSYLSVGQHIWFWAFD